MIPAYIPTDNAILTADTYWYDIRGWLWYWWQALYDDIPYAFYGESTSISHTIVTAILRFHSVILPGEAVHRFLNIHILLNTWCYPYMMTILWYLWHHIWTVRLACWSGIQRVHSSHSMFMFHETLRILSPSKCWLDWCGDDAYCSITSYVNCVWLLIAIMKRTILHSLFSCISFYKYTMIVFDATVEIPCGIHLPSMYDTFDM